VTRKPILLVAMLCAIVTLGVSLTMCAKKPPQPKAEPANAFELPAPRLKGSLSVEEALSQRRSIREYKDAPLTLEEVSQLLWAAQGITDSRGYRTAPSAGALYPLELYLVAGQVEGLGAGVYHYIPDGHSLLPLASGDRRAELAAAALGQSYVREAPIDLVLSAVTERTTSHYGYQGIQYVHMEVGHVGQNVHLQAVSLGLGTVMIGAFTYERVKQVLALPKEEVPLYIMPVGRLP